MDEPFLSETLEFEVQTDILTLLENVECQRNNPSGLKQALLALATICSTNSASQDCFYAAGGVNELKSLLLDGSCPLLAVPAALYCLACAVRNNVTSQNSVLTEDMLTVIHGLLSHIDSSDKLLQAAAFLLACAVAGSSRGQFLANETGCLQDLIDVLRNCITSGCDDESKWSVVTRAIGVCVNNPQNVHNQQICCSVLPHTLKLISTESAHKCLSHVFTLIGVIVANNVANQNRVRRCGGVEIIVQFIKGHVYLEGTPLPLALLATAVSAIDACIADNEESGAQAGKLGLVPVLIDLLKESDLDLSHVQIFILTLAHLLESCNEYCHVVTNGKGYHVLVSYLADSTDEELCKVIKYILTLCKTTGITPRDNVLNQEYSGSSKQAVRDVNTFLKEGLSGLSSQLNQIEQISENIQWMKTVCTQEPLNNIEVNSCSDKMMDEYHRPGEFLQRPENVDAYRQSWLGCEPNTSNMNKVSSDNRMYDQRKLNSQSNDLSAHKLQNSRPIYSDSFSAKYRENIGDKEQMISLDPSKRRNVTESNQYSVKDTRFNKSRLHPQNNGSGFGNIDFDDRYFTNDMRLGEEITLVGSSYRPSTKDKHIRDRNSWEDVHTSAVCHHSSEDFENIILHQGLHNSSQPLIMKDTVRSRLHSVCGSSSGSKLWNSSCLKNQLGTNRKIEENVSYKKISNIKSLRQQRPQETISDRMQLMQCYKENAYGKHLHQDRQTSSPCKTMYCREQDHRQTSSPCKTMYCREQDHQEDGLILSSSSLNHMGHLGSINNVQLSEDSVDDCTRPHINLQRDSEYIPTAEINNCQRLYDESLHCVPIISPPRGTKTHSPKSSTSQLYVPSVRDALSISESHSHNNVSEYEEVKNSNASADNNQFYLLAQLQNVMSAFFKSFLPAQVTSPSTQSNIRNNGNASLHIDQSSPTRSENQILDEQRLHSLDIFLPPASTVSKNILSLCEVAQPPNREMSQPPNREVSQPPNREVSQPPNREVSQPHNRVVSQPPNEDEQQEKSNKEVSSQTLAQKQYLKGQCGKSLKIDFSENFKDSHNTPVNTEHDNQSVIHYDNQETSVHATTKTNTTAEAESSIKSVTSVQEVQIFSKPLQPPPSRSHIIFNQKTNQPCSNVRLAGTPLTAKMSAETPVIKSSHLLAPSPALSQFDSQLRRIARMGSENSSMMASMCHPILQKSDNFRRKLENSCSSNTNENMTSVLSSSKRSKAQADENKPTSHPLGGVTDVVPLPLCRINATCLGTPQPITCMDRHFLSQNVAKTAGNPYKPSKWIKETSQGIQKDLDSCGSDCSTTSLCPGCAVSLDLNSYTYNIAIETSAYTCAYHRCVRQSERESIHQQLTSQTQEKEKVISGQTTGLDVYDFHSDSMEPTSSPSSVASNYMTTVARRASTHKLAYERKAHRTRVLYTQQELLNLLEGVAKMGKRWQQILCTYEFHHSRTAIDLKDKYKQIKMRKEKKTTEMPLSMCEIRRLKDGVKKLGYNWKGILTSYRFLPGRTAADLHKQWKSLNKLKT